VTPRRARVLPPPSAIPRTVILAATRSDRLRGLGRRYGMRLGARRFVAGEQLEDCIAVLRRLAGEGLRGYAILLGESVHDRQAVARTVHTYVSVIERLGQEGLPITMSLKLTHLGLLIDEALAFESARRILGAGAAAGMFARLDMEGSPTVDSTLRIYRRLRAEGLDNTGVVLQAYLHRTPADLAGLLDHGLNVRIVKGAYLEPPSVAIARKGDVDRQYVELARAALKHAAFTAVATHDERIIAALGDAIARRSSDYELQMLYGVRPALQSRLTAEGHPVRVCVPYGGDWFVYFGRRLAERPANVLFVVRSLLRG
jgi:proline dehydrogenase